MILPESGGQFGNTGWSPEALLAHFTASLAATSDRLEGAIEANDRRYEQRFTDSVTAVNAAMSAAKEAVVKAEAAADKRFESVNEFRATLADQQRDLMPRPEAELRLVSLESQVAELIRVNATERGSIAGAKAVVAYIIAGVGLLVGVIGIALRFMGTQ